ncbi:MAG: fluoride efflux transporter CrcB [Oscillospiraceae bacterium]|nr:fluoride efflux transporter CrcB [Oscillospiraceae bacterium]
MINCLAVGFGGFLGSVCRYLIGLLPLGSSGGFPYKTLLINVVGALALGFLSVWATKLPSVPASIVLMLKVGICGGFTTFSTFALESSALFGGGKPGQAVLYIAASLCLGIAAVFAGQRLAS